MNTAVVGGTGLLGSRVARRLTEAGESVRVISRTSAPIPIAGVDYRTADLVTGEGLAVALDGVDTVIDASNNRKAEQLLTGTESLVAAAAAAGVQHFVAIGVVGARAGISAYDRAKAAQEDLITAGPVPWTLLRATQVHPFVVGLLDAFAAKRILPVGTLLLQPVDPDPVADAVAAAARQEPAGLLGELAGPEVLTLTEVVRRYRAHRDVSAVSLPIPMIGRSGRALSAGAMCAPEAAIGGRTLENWLAESPAVVSASAR